MPCHFFPGHAIWAAHHKVSSLQFTTWVMLLWQWIAVELWCFVTSCSLCAHLGLFWCLYACLDFPSFLCDLHFHCRNGEWQALGTLFSLLFTVRPEPRGLKPQCLSSSDSCTQPRKEHALKTWASAIVLQVKATWSTNSAKVKKVPLAIKGLQAFRDCLKLVIFPQGIAGWSQLIYFQFVCSRAQDLFLFSLWLMLGCTHKDKYWRYRLFRRFPWGNYSIPQTLQ